MADSHLCSYPIQKGLSNSCTPLPKAAKPVRAKQLTRLPCLVIYAKFQFVYTTKRLNCFTFFCSCEFEATKDIMVRRRQI